MTTKKTAKHAPPGFLLAWQVCEMLGVSSSWVSRHSRNTKATPYLPKVYPYEGSREGYYPEETIHALARKKETALSHAHTRGDEPTRPPHA